MNLISDRLIFKHYSKIDFNDFKAVLMNDEVMKHISGKGNSEKVTREKFKKVLKTNSENKNLGFYNITLKETKHLVGFAKLVHLDDAIEIGYALLKMHWGRGFASEITKNLIIHAKKHFPNKEIIGIVNLGNNASKNVLKKQQFIIYDTGILDGFEVEYFKLAH